MIPLNARVLTIGAFACLAALSFALGRCSKPAPAAPFDRMQVDSQAVSKGQPDARLSLPERVVRPAVKADYQATAKGAARAQVARFCDAAVRVDTVLSADTVLRVDTVKPPAYALVTSGIIERRRLTLWSVNSAGDKTIAPYRVRLPAHFTVDGDSLLVQSSRFGVLRELAPVAPCAAGGVLSGETGSWLPAAIGCAISGLLIAR